MRPLTVLSYYLWFAPHVLLVGVVLVMWRRRLTQSFRWFFAYVTVEVIQFPILLIPLYLPSMNGAIYFRMYYVCMAVSTFFRLGIIGEAVRQLFRDSAVLQRSGRQLFRWLAAGLLLAGLVLAAYSDGNTADRVWFLVNVLNRTALILQTGLLVALFAITRYLGLSWRSQMLGICLGLGLYACVDLVGAAIRSQTGAAYNVALNYLSMGAYHATTVIWLVYLLAPERALLRVAPAQHDQVEAEAWNRELERLLHQ